MNFQNVLHKTIVRDATPFLLFQHRPQRFSSKMVFLCSSTSYYGWRKRELREFYQEVGIPTKEGKFDTINKNVYKYI